MIICNNKNLASGHQPSLKHFHIFITGRKKLLTYRHDVDGCMQNIGIKTFSEWIVEELNGNIPGDYRKTRATSARLLRTPANDRAREGFRYWYLEKKPSTCKDKLSLSLLRVLSVDL